MKFIGICTLPLYLLCKAEMGMRESSIRKEIKRTKGSTKCLIYRLEFAVMRF